MPSTPLTTLLESAPDQAYSLKIQQVVALCGDGSLRDETDCEMQFRKFLETAPSEQLAVYASECLSDSFQAGGLVLQDIVNELGRRLDYEVRNGLYQGRVNKIGFDGIWSDNHRAIVVEVKTSDSYRINLDKIVGYRNRLAAEGLVPPDSSVLIVVGRQDTGDLEAQVRGSRYAWTVRLISVDALSKLVAIKERTEESTTRKIHDLLVPFEYTKLDQIIEVVFDVAEDATVNGETAIPEQLDEPTNEPSAESHSQASPRDEIEATRARIVATVSQLHRPIVKKSGALYWSTDKGFRVAIAVSNRYHTRSWPYWYMYRPQWDAFLKDAKTGFYILGCVDLDMAFAIPFERIHNWLKRLRTTDRGNKFYWHVDLNASSGHENEALFRLVDPRIDERIGGFAIPLNKV